MLSFLLDRLKDIDEVKLKIGSNLEAEVTFADQKSMFFKPEIDKYIEANGIDAEPPSEDLN